MKKETFFFHCLLTLLINKDNKRMFRGFLRVDFVFLILKYWKILFLKLQNDGP